LETEISLTYQVTPVIFRDHGIISCLLFETWENVRIAINCSRKFCFNQFQSN